MKLLRGPQGPLGPQGIPLPWFKAHASDISAIVALSLFAGMIFIWSCILSGG